MTVGDMGFIPERLLMMMIRLCMLTFDSSALPCLPLPCVCSKKKLGSVSEEISIRANCTTLILKVGGPAMPAPSAGHRCWMIAAACRIAITPSRVYVRPGLRLPACLHASWLLKRCCCTCMAAGCEGGEQLGVSRGALPAELACDPKG